MACDFLRHLRRTLVGALLDLRTPTVVGVADNTELSTSLVLATSKFCARVKGSATVCSISTSGSSVSKSDLTSVSSS